MDILDPNNLYNIVDTELIEVTAYEDCYVAEMRMIMDSSVESTTLTMGYYGELGEEGEFFTY